MASKSSSRRSKTSPTVFYLDAGGRAYDLSYKYSEGATSLLSLHAARHPIPVAEDPQFKTFAEYEAALLQWSKRIERTARTHIPPTPLGHVFYRPPRHELNLEDDSLEEAVDTTTPQKEETNEISPDLISSGLLPERHSFERHADASKRLSNWRSTLFPSEPRPDLYTNYKDYSTALKKWASLVKKTVPRLPPSASELGSLLPLLEPSKHSGPSGYTSLIDVSPPTLTIHSLPQFGIPRSYDISPRKVPNTGLSPRLWQFEEGATLSKNSHEKLERLLTGWGSKTARLGQKSQKASPNESVVYNYDVFGNTRSVIVKEASLFDPYTGDQEYLRRTPGTRNQTPDEDHRMQVVPYHSLPGLNVSKLLGSPEELARARVEYQQLSCKFLSQQATAMYNAQRVPVQTENDELLRLTNFISGDNLTSESLSKIVLGDDHVDLLYIALCEPTSHSPSLISYLAHGALSAANIPLLEQLKDPGQLLDIVLNTNRKTVHAKAALLLILKLHLPSSSDFLNELIAENTNIAHLCLIPHLLSFFGPTTFPPFDCEEHALVLIIRFIASFDIPVKAARDFLLLFHRFRCTHVTLTILHALGKSPHIDDIENLKFTYLGDIEGFLLRYPIVLRESLIEGVAHPSRSLSSVFVSLIEHVFKFRGALSLVLAPQRVFYAQLIGLSGIHTTTARRGFSTIAKSVCTLHGDDFRRFLMHKSTYIKLLVTPSTPLSFSTLVCELIEADVEKYRSGNILACEPPTPTLNYTKMPRTYGWWLDGTLFQTLYEHAIVESNGDVVTCTPQVALRLVMMVCFSRLNWASHKVRLSQGVKVKKSRQRSLSRSVSLKPPLLVKISHIEGLLEFIKNTTGSSTTLVNKCRVLALRTLRLLMKTPGNYRVAMASPLLLKSLTSFCEGKHPANCNREFISEAWRTFYHMARHHEEFMSTCISEAKSFRALIGALSGSSSNSVNESALSYFSKMMEIPTLDKAKKLFHYRSKKSVDNDTKAFVAFLLENRFLFQLHNLYKALQLTKAGPAYNALFQHIHVVVTSDSATKLFKEAMKNPQYKGMLMEVAAALSLTLGKSKKDQVVEWG